MTKYYTLLINDGALNEEPSSRWMIEFGDASKKVVEQERRDSHGNVPKKFTKIICTDGTQKMINETVHLLNGASRTYRLGSSSMVAAPGIVRWAISGAVFKRDVPAMTSIVADTWSIPHHAAEALVTKRVPYKVDGETVEFTVQY